MESFVKVALFMLDESRNPYSKWKAFLETQPKDWSNHFLQLEEEDIELMRGSILYDEAKKAKKDLQKYWITLEEKAPIFTKTFT